MSVIKFPGATILPGRATDVLQSAIEADLETVIIIGCDQDGDFWFSGNKSYSPDILWWLEQAKKQLIEV